MQPAVGSIVQYTMTAADAEAVNRRRADFEAFNRANRDTAAAAGAFPGRSGHIGHYGNQVSEGDTCPAIVVRTFEIDGPANLKVHLDGNDDYWAPSRSEGDGPGFWRCPERAE